MIARLKKRLNIWWHKPLAPDDHRLWIHFGNSCLAIEGHFLKRACSCSVILHLNSGDGDQITIGLCLPRLFSIYVSLESRILRRLMPGEWRDSSIKPGEKFFMDIQRQIGIRIFDGTIWFSLWENPMEWNSSDPWWWSFNIKPVNLLLGQEHVSSNKATAQKQDIAVRMPEGVYKGKLRLYIMSRKRPRWPIATHINRYEIEMDEPIPVPGKGENSWDMEQDAVHAISGVASTSDQAIIELLDSVNASRVRRGGAMWLPERAPCGKGDKDASTKMSDRR